MAHRFDEVIDRSASNADKYVLRERLFGTVDLLPMWVADMDIATPPFVVEAVKQRAEHPVYGYEEMPDSAFEAQMGWMERRHSLSLEREWLFYSPSVVASISAAIEAFTRPGQKVVVQTPVYPPFFKRVEESGRRLLLNPLKRLGSGDYSFDLEGLAAAIDKDTKLLLLCSPHNPVGRVWRREELEALAAICLERGVRVFADEIHADLVYAPHRHIPFASLSDEVRAITLSAFGPGKTFNLAGLATSTLAIADETMRDAFKQVHERIHFGPGSIFGHAAFEAAYRQGDGWLDDLLGHLEGNAALLKALCDRHGIGIRPPEGTYLAWMDCSNLGLSDPEMSRFFIAEAKLGLSPGILFGREGAGFMRLNFAVPTPIMSEALERLERALPGRFQSSRA